MLEISLEEDTVLSTWWAYDFLQWQEESNHISGVIGSDRNEFCYFATTYDESWRIDKQKHTHVEGKVLGCL